MLPPGDWDSKNLLSVDEIEKMRKRRRKRQMEAAASAAAAAATTTSEEAQSNGGEDEKKYGDPLERSGDPFGGLINDVKRRFPWFKSDFEDALNTQCVGAVFFIFFACLSPAIAFGGLYGERAFIAAAAVHSIASLAGDKTEDLIGVPVTLITTCVGGIAFALLSGMPLVVVGEYRAEHHAHRTRN